LKYQALPNFESYQIFVFDLDGLIIDSLNDLSKCLVGAVSNYASESELDAFQKYDVKNPGASRFTKVDYFLQEITQEKDPDTKRIEILNDFSERSFYARKNAKISSGFEKFVTRYQNLRHILLSNCDNSQIVGVSEHHGITKYFNSGIIGTPPSKELRAEAIRSEFPDSQILSLSDSESDAVIARKSNFDFLYVNEFARGCDPWILENEFRVESFSSCI
jgi:phosphoglycolate phosphatase-like HAD superfamily hydrolase